MLVSNIALAQGPSSGEVDGWKMNILKLLAGFKYVLLSPQKIEEYFHFDDFSDGFETTN